MAKSGQPRTGDGRTGGQKPNRLQVTAKSPTGTTLWGQTVALFSKKAPPSPPPAKSAKATRAKRNPMFDN